LYIESNTFLEEHQVKKTFWKIVWIERGMQRVRGGLDDAAVQRYQRGLMSTANVRDIRVTSYAENHDGETDAMAGKLNADYSQRPISSQHI
jgi:hypothetical protein